MARLTFQLAVIVALLTACQQEDIPLLPWYEDTAALTANYTTAMATAQNMGVADVSTTLMPISDDNGQLEWALIGGRKMVLVCAALNHENLKYWTSDSISKITKESGIWVTIPAEWHRQQQEFASLDSVAARYRLVQILGLWPACNYDTVVEFYADPSGIFHPARDPSISTTTCGVDFPAWADENYTVGDTNFRQWFALQEILAYENQPPCPWTRLGYTYDWHYGSARQGLSEYVVSNNTPIKIKSRKGCWTFINGQVLTRSQP